MGDHTLTATAATKQQPSTGLFLQEITREEFAGLFGQNQATVKKTASFKPLPPQINAQLLQGRVQDHSPANAEGPISWTAEEETQAPPAKTAEKTVNPESSQRSADPSYTLTHTHQRLVKHGLLDKDEDVGNKGLFGDTEVVLVAEDVVLKDGAPPKPKLSFFQRICSCFRRAHKDEAEEPTTPSLSSRVIAWFRSNLF